jgi:hypothetical protein
MIYLKFTYRPLLYMWIPLSATSGTLFRLLAYRSSRPIEIGLIIVTLLELIVGMLVAALAVTGALLRSLYGTAPTSRSSRPLQGWPLISLSQAPIADFVGTPAVPILRKLHAPAPELVDALREHPMPGQGLWQRTNDADSGFPGSLQ